MNLIKNHISALLERSDRTAKQDNLAVETEDFEYAPFVQKGGPLKAGQLFGQDLQNILKELSEVSLFVVIRGLATLNIIF